MEKIVEEQAFDQNLNSIVKEAVNSLKYAFNKETIEEFSKIED